ncbi:isoprenylcysteine carboxylmethyltransferase family protein [bacterium]|nr:isoprenylcysteine carboxylmethyltransferase family protein [bacterium]
MRKIMPPNYFYFLLIMLLITHFVFPKYHWISSPFRYIGILPILFGIILNLWTDHLFKKMSTTVKPHELPSTLITTGPFKISRHPMYVGMLSILLGTALICGTVLTLLYPILFIILMEVLFISMEDNNLTRQFGDDYLQYKKRTRRWI